MSIENNSKLLLKLEKLEKLKVKHAEKSLDLLMVAMKKDSGSEERLELIVDATKETGIAEGILLAMEEIERVDVRAIKTSSLSMGLYR